MPGGAVDVGAAGAPCRGARRRRGSLLLSEGPLRTAPCYQRRAALQRTHRPLRSRPQARRRGEGAPGGRPDPANSPLRAQHAESLMALSAARCASSGCSGPRSAAGGLRARCRARQGGWRVLVSTASNVEELEAGLGTCKLIAYVSAPVHEEVGSRGSGGDCPGCPVNSVKVLAPSCIPVSLLHHLYKITFVLSHPKSFWHLFRSGLHVIQQAGGAAQERCAQAPL
jgi:hypothetical protein